MYKNGKWFGGENFIETSPIDLGCICLCSYGCTSQITKAKAKQLHMNQR
jgi:hypothetical protein